jgi:hypothetical protein
MTIDRRRWRRLSRELRLKVHIPDGAGERVVGAIGSHLNPEGIFVELTDPPPLGTRVRVTLAAEGTEGLLTAEGEVVDRVESDPTGARAPGIGLRIDQAGPAWQKLYAWLGDVG